MLGMTALLTRRQHRSEKGASGPQPHPDFVEVFGEVAFDNREGDVDGMRESKVRRIRLTQAPLLQANKPKGDSVGQSKGVMRRPNPDMRENDRRRAASITGVPGDCARNTERKRNRFTISEKTSITHLARNGFAHSLLMCGPFDCPDNGNNPECPV
jgi:hypothetical protein